MHPTVLTLTTASVPSRIGLTGTLTDTCTGSGVGPRAVITFTTSTAAPLAAAGLTDAAGQYATSTFAALGTYRAL